MPSGIRRDSHAVLNRLQGEERGDDLRVPREALKGFGQVFPILGTRLHEHGPDFPRELLALTRRDGQPPPGGKGVPQVHFIPAQHDGRPPARRLLREIDRV